MRSQCVDVNTIPISKGKWYVGDIASTAFKRRMNAERSRQRFHYRTKTTHEVDIAPADQINAAYLALQIEVGAGQKTGQRSLPQNWHVSIILMSV